MKKIICVLLLQAGICLLPAQSPLPAFADLHCHSLLKPFYSGWDDLWAFHEHECHADAYDLVLEKAADVPKFTQSNFESLLMGNVRVAYLSLTPLEYEMRHPKVFRELAKLRNTVACMSGISPSWEFFLDEKVDYFKDLLAELKLLEDGNRKPYLAGKDTLRYEVLGSSAQMADVLRHPGRLGIVVSIEGAHALGQGPLTPELLASAEYQEEVLEHLDILKGSHPFNDAGDFLNHPVAVMTLNHFMWNGLSGHAKTFSKVMGYFIDQDEGMNSGFTDLGKQVVERMLDKSKGRRILVDVKHMGVEARQWYYAHLAEMRLQGDTVPVVATHVGISGDSWQGMNTEKNGSDLNKEAWLNHSPISMFDEDIREIHLSHGILGLMLDKHRCGGDLGNELVDASREGSAQRRKAYIHLLVANMLAVVDAVQSKEAWDIISIGSDFDGMISAMEPYDQAIKLPSLREDLIDYFEEPEDIFDLFPRRKVERYMYGMDAREIVDKVMGGNLLRFTQEMFDRHLGLPMGRVGSAAEGR